MQQVLTAREQDVVRLVALGYPDKRIAAALRISPWTVHQHLQNIFRKTGCTNRTQLAVQALNNRGHLEGEYKP